MSDPSRPKNVVVLGSTGSIGESSLKVARDLPGRMKLVGLAANRSADALAAHAHTTGCTAHLVTSDASNPILAQESVPIAPDETAASLRPRINAAERALLPRVIAAHCLTPP